MEIPKPTPLGRPELLAAVAQASDAFAAGRPAPEAVTQLAGRRFEVRLPFGCRGPVEAGALRYAWDADSRRLMLSARAEVLTKTPWAKALVDDAASEAIEGFWISRPWITSSDCPARAGSADAFAASPETVGLVQVFEAGGSRLLRRNGRPYEVTLRLPENQTPPAAGYRLVLAGRIADTGEQPPIRCRAADADQRPVCLVQVELGRVAFESVDGEQHAEWTS